MKIFIDADSCPQRVRFIIYKASKKNGIACIQVANRLIPCPRQFETIVRNIIVESREGAADTYILQESVPGDLVITRDIPLASDLLEKGITVINDRGGEFSPDTIRERLSLRDIMADFRAFGLLEAGQKRFGEKEVKAFADCFSRVLHNLLNSPD